MAVRDLPHPLLQTRRAGVLLHPTSLPGPDAMGTLGRDAYQFVDWLAAAGFGLWQMLPIGPTHQNLSPYQTLSVQAGNPELISLDDLVAQGWLTQAQREQEKPAVARALAAGQFFAHWDPESDRARRFEHFCQAHRYWLEDYALFDALRESYGGESWCRWPDDIRLRRTQGLTRMRRELKVPIDVRRFEQFVFFEQWQALRQYARDKHVFLFGDMPIFVAYDSADVWANQDLFNLDGDGNPLTVAGVPPDYFSETGQHWGNPHYNWDEMQAQNFRWWRQRFNTQLALFDLIRLDHFRGLEAYWEIPADHEDASRGRWVKSPGRALLNSLFREHKNLPLVAENLGLITPEVEALRREFRLPGMVVLQFAFDGNADNPHLPHEHDAHNIVYTGTHDNDTSLGWYQSQPEEVQQRLRAYCFESGEPVSRLMVCAALASVARIAIVPLQDLLALDGTHRMNTPGTDAGNWRWRFQWDWFQNSMTPEIKRWLTRYGRRPEVEAQPPNKPDND